MSNVTPIHDLHRETGRLLERIARALDNTPADGLQPGYHHTLETRLDLFQAIRLLRDAYHALRRAQEREDPIYNAYYDASHSQEALT